MSPEQLTALEQLEMQVNMLSRGLRDLNKFIVAEFKQMRTLLLANHEHQLKQLRACQRSHEMAVERDEELRETLAESANPWS